MGLILAFDTATPATTVALARGDEVAEARHDPAPGERPGHQTQLLALIDEVMRDAGAGWEDIDRLAVGVGPGTFTGLRIGVATARALAQARAIDLVGISTLESLAMQAEGSGPKTCMHAIGSDPSACTMAVLDARRGEAFAAAWRGADRLLAPAALSPDALAAAAAALPAIPLAVGDGAVRFRERLEAIGADVPPDADAVHRVSARQHCRLAAGVPAGGPDEILPEYLRVPDADTSHAKRAR
jgi:tRNA threonylcarbamoyladenosine biosynthesis protein TsaB